MRVTQQFNGRALQIMRAFPLPLREGQGEGGGRERVGSPHALRATLSRKGEFSR